MTIERATFGAGCFWKVEDEFRQLPGVTRTSVGYMGGHFPNPSYLDVVARITGHAEVAQIEYDSTKTSYETLLEKFWEIHDPTSLNRQGADRGEQYRSVIFYHNDLQKTLALKAKNKWQLSQRYDKDIVTEIKPSSDYYLATEDHQQYLEKKRKQTVLKT